MKSVPINYDGRTFSPVVNSETGEVSSATHFHYHQDSDIFWAEYSGGEILRGFMIGLVRPDGQLEFKYQHLNKDRAIRLGECLSTPEILADGRIRLHESWRWLDGEQQKGTSIVDEKT
ncbi:MAG: n-acetylglutamate synthase [Deltaproteobacteria bacterium]|nr:n-acetylglutamate synthase [Deltaproteobacteria bacterium]